MVILEVQSIHGAHVQHRGSATFELLRDLVMREPIANRTKLQPNPDVVIDFAELVVALAHQSVNSLLEGFGVVVHLVPKALHILAALYEFRPEERAPARKPDKPVKCVKINGFRARRESKFKTAKERSLEGAGNLRRLEPLAGSPVCIEEVRAAGALFAVSQKRDHFVKYRNSFCWERLNRRKLQLHNATNKPRIGHLKRKPIQAQSQIQRPLNCNHTEHRSA